MAGEFSIIEFGALADGVTKCTDALAKAIDAASRAGGGRVVVPRGAFLTGPIVLRSHVELHLADGATILFSRDFDDYPLVATDWEGLPDVRCISPIWGEDLVNVSITGKGTINGQGEAWRYVKKKKMTPQQWDELLASGGVLNEEKDICFPTRGALDGLKIAEDLRKSGKPLRVEDFAPARDALRPNMVKLTRCRQVLLDGPTFTNSAAWNVHLLLCENAVVRNVTILNPWWSQNGDALDIDACRDVTVEHSVFDAGDDAICIKSGKDEPGRRRGVPCQNIAVRNCTVLHGHGGVTIGSEMSGGVRNVSVSNCLFRGTDIGLRFKTTRGRGGVVENIDVTNVAMHDIRHEAISLNMYYFVKDPRPEPVSERTPAFRSFHFRNITCDGAARAIELRGLPEMPVENITLENVRMRADRGALLSDAKDVTFRNVHLEVGEVPAVHAHNVANLRMDNVTGTGPFDVPTGQMGDLLTYSLSPVRRGEGGGEGRGARDVERRSIVRASLAPLPNPLPGVPGRGSNGTPMPSPRQELRLDADWLFHLGDIDSPVPRDKHIAAYMANKAGWARGAARVNYDDSDWRVVNLPHDWSVEGPIEQSNYLHNGFRPRGVGWYRKHLRLDESDRGRYLAIRFDGVSSHCTVYVNGHLLHRHFGGYTSFTVDISDVATFGDDAVNVIAVRVDATPIEGWWYEGAGIYRHVSLTKTSPIHFGTDGVFVNPVKLDGTRWLTWVEATLENMSDSTRTCELYAEFRGIPGDAYIGEVEVLSRSSAIVRHSFPTKNPRLWSCETPTLHEVRFMIRDGDETVIDDVVVRFGYRTIRFDPDHGFFLNDQPLKLKGTCNHQDHAGVGVAVPDSIHEFRIRRLKEMGCNAYRCSHHPPAPELLDACDRLGMLVLDENRTFGSSPEHLSQVRTMVLRDRNHPSVIVWSLCNEEAIQGTPVAANIAKAMAQEVTRLDPSRPVTAAVSGGILNDDCIADSIEVCGINYQLPMHDPYHAKHPHVPVIAAETHSTFSTRGTYETSGHYFPCYDEDAAPWGATARGTWRHVSWRPYLAGLFAWTGFDYRGEPTPHSWPVINSQFGIMDTCGFEKDAFYLHKAWWTDESFVHVLPHWNWDAGREVRVMAYTNCEAVELFLNGESLGRKSVDPIDMAEWRVAYRPGQLRAVAYRGDRSVAEKMVETTGSAVALGLEVHPSARTDSIPADGEFALPITVFATDEQGRRVPTAGDHVTFAIDGPATLLGVGNGDPTCHEPDKASSRTLFHGLAQVIIQTATTPGEIRLTARAPGRASASLVITSSPAPIRPGITSARRKLLLTEWRMSPITPHRPEAAHDVAEQDMNSWERVVPGQPQSAWSAARGYAIYRTTFTPPKVLQTTGGVVVFREVRGNATYYVNGHRAGAGGRAPFAPGAQQIMLSVILEGAGPGSGLVGPVEVCAAS